MQIKRGPAQLPASIKPRPLRRKPNVWQHRDPLATLGSKTLEFLPAGSIDFGSTRAAPRCREEQRPSDQVDRCRFAPP
jgi:hypothetical protein